MSVLIQIILTIVGLTVCLVSLALLVYWSRVLHPAQERALAQIDRLIALLEAANKNMSIGLAGVQAGVKRMEATAVSVAQDLDDTHERAEQVEGAPGEASDAAMRRK